jgi:hypothetical protein
MLFELNECLFGERKDGEEDAEGVIYRFLELAVKDLEGRLRDSFSTGVLFSRERM